MKCALVSAYIFTVLFVIVASWSKEDQEIFRLRHEVEATEGPGVTFYDFLGTKPSANHDEINKAYRRKSRTLHPDKVKRQFITEKSVKRKPTKAETRAAAKAASDRFARLGIVANILRGPGRERYDHFLNYGFPTWKGTGFYYARFRPGLRTVLAGLFVLVGGVGHWIALYLSWKRQREFIIRYIKFARHTAWGDSIPGLEETSASTATMPAEVQAVNRRQRRMQEKDNKKEKKVTAKKTMKPATVIPSESARNRKRVVAENGKILVVDSSGDVYLEQVDEDGETQEFLLHPDELPKPSFTDTALCQLPVWAYSIIITRVFHRKQATPAENPEDEEELDAADSGRDNFELLESDKKTAENGSNRTYRKKKNHKTK
ncbi:putative J domain-containing protein C2E1P5.03 [Golovinomyces cichoracearum]|uniref:Putative J domain-containing protein C2E1P5.03 n=1 Tax=Golovinomyces cichoracearum TaxID=62708 RepID=A0A420IH13_9PEZI|nr:putative J domain-containing protein C2E1P5.03 [Golovinomyces cichoracearum]